MRAAAAFVGMCAASIPAWWLVLYQSSEWRGCFVPEKAWPAFRFVVVPDVILAMATAMAAVQLVGGRATALLPMVVGGWIYATAFSIAWAVSAGAPANGPVLMVAALVGLRLVWHAVVSTRSTSRR